MSKHYMSLHYQYHFYQIPPLSSQYIFMNPPLQIIISPYATHVAGSMAGIMFVAILSLFLVFFFVALLHCYARWFLARGGEGRRPPPVLVVPPVVVGTHRLLILRHLLYMDSVLETSDRAPQAKGLDPRALSSIPVFICDEEKGDCELECVICLSLFVSGEKGKRLALCGHAFHVGCIDTWLHSHTTCPVCRAPAACSSCNANDVVVDSISDDHENNASDWNVGGLTSPDGTRMNDRSSNGLDIVVEVPHSEGGSNCIHKVISSSNHVE